MMDIHMRRLQTFILAFFFVLAGCSSHVQHLPKIEPDANIFPPLEERSSLLVGIALSGGGSRAAYFGAAGIEALQLTVPAAFRCRRRSQATSTPRATISA